MAGAYCMYLMHSFADDVYTDRIPIFFNCSNLGAVLLVVR